MSNKEIYSKTLGFSLRRLLFDVLAFAGIGLLGLIGFIITEKAADEGMIGLLVGTLIGIVLAVFVLRYVSYAFKAGQIAMITRLLTKGDAGENVIDEGCINLKFVLQDCHSPFSLGQSEDVRELGLGFLKMSISHSSNL